ncbi:fractalkine [Lacerta agilis]|uniref:fractalkine n=1 Tax=Lacerta agilis TaxID=80427 RepID=UPI00141A016D|nr:fractalkine [Lacerta agilis]
MPNSQGQEKLQCCNIQRDTGCPPLLQGEDSQYLIRATSSCIRSCDQALFFYHLRRQLASLDKTLHAQFNLSTGLMGISQEEEAQQMQAFSARPPTWTRLCKKYRANPEEGARGRAGSVTAVAAANPINHPRENRLDFPRGRTWAAKGGVPPSGREGRGSRRGIREWRCCWWFSEVRIGERGSRRAALRSARLSRRGRSMPDPLLVALGWVVAAAAFASTWPVQVAGEPEVAKGCANECRHHLTKPIALIRLHNYTKRTCGTKTSVILITKKNLKFCARPEEVWVQEVMRQLDAQNTPTEATAGFGKHLGGTVPISAHPGGPPDTTVTFTTATYAPKPTVMVTGTTLHPQTLASGTMVSQTSVGPKRYEGSLATVGKGLEEFPGSTRDLVASPSSSPISNFITADSTAKGTRPTTAPAAPPASSKQPTPVLSSSSTGTGRQSTVGLPTAEANMHTSTNSAGTLSTPGFHQENTTGKSRAQPTTSTPEVPFAFSPGALAGPRSHTIFMASVGTFLCLTIVAVVWASARPSICTRTPPGEVVQGLLFTSSESQSDALAMDIL